MPSTNTNRQMEHNIAHFTSTNSLYVSVGGAAEQSQCKCAGHFTQTLHNIVSPLTGIQLEAHKGHRRQRRPAQERNQLEIIEIKFCISEEVRPLVDSAPSALCHQTIPTD